MQTPIRDCRLRKGWTLEVLAAKLDMTAMSLSRLERGETQMTLDKVTRLAEALDVHWIDIIGPALGLPGDEVALVKDYSAIHAPEHRQMLSSMAAALARQRPEPLGRRAAEERASAPAAPEGARQSKRRSKRPAA